MGYTTDFDGEVTVEPPLNAAEVAYLKGFGATRRMRRDNGPYFIGGTGMMGQGHDPDVQDFNMPPDGQPGLWCQWEPSEDGRYIGWDGGEKFYRSAEWMAYLIDHFLKPDAEASRSGEGQFNAFTFDHSVNGEITAEGEDPDDRWKLIVRDNVVKVAQGEIVYAEPE